MPVNGRNASRKIILKVALSERGNRWIYITSFNRKQLLEKSLIADFFLDLSLQKHRKSKKNHSVQQNETYDVGLSDAVLNQRVDNWVQMW